MYSVWMALRDTSRRQTSAWLLLFGASEDEYNLYYVRHILYYIVLVLFPSAVLPLLKKSLQCCQLMPNWPILEIKNPLPRLI